MKEDVRKQAEELFKLYKDKAAINRDLALIIAKTMSTECLFELSALIREERLRNYVQARELITKLIPNTLKLKPDVDYSADDVCDIINSYSEEAQRRAYELVDKRMDILDKKRDALCVSLANIGLLDRKKDYGSAVEMWYKLERTNLMYRDFDFQSIFRSRASYKKFIEAIIKREERYWRVSNLHLILSSFL